MQMRRVGLCKWSRLISSDKIYSWVRIENDMIEGIFNDFNGIYFLIKP